MWDSVSLNLYGAHVQKFQTFIAKFNVLLRITFVCPLFYRQRVAVSVLRTACYGQNAVLQPYDLPVTREGGAKRVGVRCHWKSVQASYSSHLHANPVERISVDAELWSVWEDQPDAGIVFYLSKYSR